MTCTDCGKAVFFEHWPFFKSLCGMCYRVYLQTAEHFRKSQ